MIDPANLEGDLIRHLEGGVWSQAKHKLLKLQEAAVERVDVESLLKCKYWEQCIAKKHQQPDFYTTARFLQGDSGLESP